MVGEDVKQTRTTCDAITRKPRGAPPPEGLTAGAVCAGAGRRPKRVVHDAAQDAEPDDLDEAPANGAGPSPVIVEVTPQASAIEVQEASPPEPAPPPVLEAESDELDERVDIEEGPAHRRLIRATLPRIEGAPPPTRPAPDFTIRQPNNRHGRFRHARGASPFSNGTGRNGGNGGNSGGDGMPRHEADVRR